MRPVRLALMMLGLTIACGRPSQPQGEATPNRTQAASEPPARDSAKAQPPPKQEEPFDPTPGDKTVLVELYTSQGCDSCPAADAFIGEFPGLGWTPDKVVPLTFHVTYWDDLGWQDPYGAAMFDQRQISYAQTVPGARADDENTIKGPYTPQLVVDGRVHFSGTLRDVAQQEVTRASQQKTLIDLSVAAAIEEGDAKGLVRVDVTSSAVADAGLDTDKSKIGLFAALTEKSVQTEVPRGENAGKKLQEFWVVREFAGPKLFRSGRPVNETRFDLAVPDGTDPAQLDVVVFAQDLATLGVYATRTTPAQGGGPAPAPAGME